MSIKYKIAVLATLWLAGILLIVNITVYIAFLRISTDNERDYLANRAEALLDNISFTEAMNGQQSDTLNSFLPDKGMIRILDQTGHVLQQYQSDNEVAQIEAKSVQAAETEIYPLNGVQVLIVRIPAESEGHITGTLEMVEKMDALAENIGLLVTILISVTIAAIVLSAIGGLMLSKWILRPISGMVRTMEDIEKSLVFHKIRIQNKSRDELSTMASTFNRMMDRIQESFIRQQRFISDASHELRTPLTIIEGYARMLQRWGMRDEQKGREAVENIYSEAIRMKGLTQQLLNLASLEQESELVVEPVEIVSFCEDVAELLRASHHRQIIVQPFSSEITFPIDAFKIKQLLMILLDNAMKYSTDEILLLISKYEKVDGQEKVEGQEKMLEIRIKDRGIGIPQKELPYVFERFYRADPSRYRETGGMGLGLSIAREIVKLHNGTIEIRSEEHRGTEVIVRIASCR